MRTQPVRTVAIALALSTAAAVSLADSTSLISGGDRYVAGNDALSSASSARDLFLAGFRARVQGEVAGDAHVAAFSTTVAGAIDGDLYAVGGQVSVDGAVAGDASLAGFEVTLADTARVDGNLRVSAGTLVLAAPIQGSVFAGGGVLELDAPIAGDVRLAGAEIVFGERAAVGGMLVYSAPSPVSVPATVAPADRVRYEPPGSGSNLLEDDRPPFGDVMPHWRPTVASALLSGLATLFLLSVIAALALALAGERVERLRATAEARPWRALALGLLGLSAVIGAIPVALLTLIGIPLIPLILLALLLLWTLGYLLGIHVVVQRLAAAFGGRRSDALPGRLALIVVGIAAAALLNFVPVLGWLLNVALMLLGLGAMTSRTIDRLAGVDEPRRLTSDQDVDTPA